MMPTHSQAVATALPCVTSRPLIEEPMPRKSFIAEPASVRPMTMETEPVMEAGRNFSTFSAPNFLTISPAAIETKPDMMMPNCAFEISSGGKIPVACQAAICSAEPSAIAMDETADR